MEFKFCPKCSELLNDKKKEEGLPGKYKLPKDSYQCSRCREVFEMKELDGKVKIKMIWRHTGGGTSIRKDKYPSDDSYVRGAESINITCTSDRHFNLPIYMKSLSELIVLDGISPESKKELRELIEG